MKKLAILGLAVSLVLLGASGVWATPQIINDLPINGTFTASQQWRTGSTSSNDTTNHDVIGDNYFATQQMTVTSAGQLKIEILSNTPPGGITEFNYNWGTADIALNVNSSTAKYDAKTGDLTSGTSPFELGIIMSGYTGGASGSATVQLVRVTTWNTTYSEVNGLGDFYYGGAYRIAANSGDTSKSFISPVESHIAAYDPSIVATGKLTWEKNGTFGGVDQYDLIIDFPTYTNLTGVSFDVLWATALCGNDIIYGNVDPQVPIPASAVLLGTGLLGLVGLRRFRKN